MGDAQHQTTDTSLGDISNVAHQEAEASGAAILPAEIGAADLAKQIELLHAAADHGGFHFDHIPRPETWLASMSLVAAGLLDVRESGSDEAQYTALNFSITDLGRAALRSVEP